jgi:hypothetical protein
VLIKRCQTVLTERCRRIANNEVANRRLACDFERGRGKAARTCYAVTSLSVTQASPAQLGEIIRGHWGIENCSADCTYE